VYGEIRFEWDGATIYVTDDEHCLCTCWRALPASPASYYAYIFWSTSVRCGEDPCEPDEDGVYHGAVGQGELSRAGTLFEMPTDLEEIFIRPR
jgi:hypothetical protein